MFRMGEYPPGQLAYLRKRSLASFQLQKRATAYRRAVRDADNYKALRERSLVRLEALCAVCARAFIGNDRMAGIIMAIEAERDEAEELAASEAKRRRAASIHWSSLMTYWRSDDESVERTIEDRLLACCDSIAEIEARARNPSACLGFRTVRAQELISHEWIATFRALPPPWWAVPEWD